MIPCQTKSKKLYVWVDESGQDTLGRLFVVSILLMEQEKEAIEKELLNIEKVSRKKNTKWHKARNEFRKVYIEGIICNSQFKEKLFFEVFSDSKKYIELTSYATAKAIYKKAGENYKATIYVDGLKRGELAVFIKGLRDLRVRTKKIRGVKKDENNVFIRLVDALCGLIRDASDENEWAKEVMQKLKDKKIIKEL